MNGQKLTPSRIHKELISEKGNIKAKKKSKKLWSNVDSVIITALPNRTYIKLIWYKEKRNAQQYNLISEEDVMHSAMKMKAKISEFERHSALFFQWDKLIIALIHIGAT